MIKYFLLFFFLINSTSFCQEQAFEKRLEDVKKIDFLKKLDFHKPKTDAEKALNNLFKVYGDKVDRTRYSETECFNLYHFYECIDKDGKEIDKDSEEPCNVIATEKEPDKKLLAFCSRFFTNDFLQNAFKEKIKSCSNVKDWDSCINHFYSSRCMCEEISGESDLPNSDRDYQYITIYENQNEAYILYDYESAGYANQMSQAKKESRKKQLVVENKVKKFPGYKMKKENGIWKADENSCLPRSEKFKSIHLFESLKWWFAKK